jgi:hypothetical protein
MKKIIFITLSFLFAACGQKANRQIESNSISSDSVVNDIAIVNTLDSKSQGIVGTYEYVYPYNADDLSENHYIVISNSGSEYSGLYYGTTDEFDDAREGYLPGFFVANMDNLLITNDTIKFSMSVNNENIFDKPIGLNLKSSLEVKKAGYQNWIQTMNFSPKEYKGIIKDEKIFFKGESLDKTFKKKY